MHFVLLGHGKALNDCENNKLRLYKEPPPGIWALKGSYPMVSYFIINVHYS